MPAVVKIRRYHLTTTLAEDVLLMLADYSRTEGVQRNVTIENALRRFFIAERERKGKENASRG